MGKHENISVFDYTDYRLYLRDYYRFQKARKACFSYRYFACKAGFNSSGLYSDIVNGRTGMQHAMVAKFAKGLGLNRKEERYFEYLVQFNQANDAEEKKQIFERMMKLSDSPVVEMQAGQYEFYSKWYHSAVREMLQVMPFKDEYEELAKRLEPAITPAQARKSIALLRKLKLVEADKDGYLKPVVALISTGDDVTVKSMSVAGFQTEMMDLAKEAVERHPAEKRDISTLTLSISESDYLEIKSELRALRKRFLTAAERTPGPDRVYQLNMQLFPLSRDAKKTGGR